MEISGDPADGVGLDRMKAWTEVGPSVRWFLLRPRPGAASVSETQLWGVLQLHWDAQLCPGAVKPPALLRRGSFPRIKSNK